MARNRFTNPSNGAFYDWAVNHSTEQSFGKARQISESANTANTGLIKQQSDSEPLKMKLEGTIFHLEQHEEFIAWWELCEGQTIFFKDFTGDEFEVIVTSYNAVRKRTVRNPRDFKNAPLWYWTYEMELEVIRVISGAWSGVTA